MDFSLMDEQSPLADFSQANDGLDSEDTAAIATLTTQALQSKLSYEYGDENGVNGQTEAANYTESRSSPLSQYSAIIPTEPAESFRGLMEDHDRGAQFLGEDATFQYDMEPTVRGRVSDDMAGIEEPPVFLREPNPPDPFHSWSSAAAEVDAVDPKSLSHEVEMNATMTASHVVNEVLRSSSYVAATQNEVGVNMQALQSQALQLTPPEPESPFTSVEERDHTEQEKVSSISDSEQHEGDGSENPIIEEATLDIGAQQQLMMESNERSTIDGGKGSPKIRLAPEGIERPLETDTASDSVPRRPRTARIAMREKASLGTIESVVADGPELNRAEETPAAKKRGRPPKSEIPELTPTSAKRGPGRPPKLVAPEATGESTPATGKRGRPRKSDVADQTQALLKEPKLLAVEAPATTPTTSKRGRPRRSAVVEATQASTNEAQLSIVATPTLSKRGRPRKSEAVDTTQAFADEPTVSAVEAATSTPALSKRGRPRKSDVTQTPTNEPQPSIVQTQAATPALSKRGRPPKASVTMSAATPGKRGRPPKSAVPAEAQASTTKDTTKVAAPSAMKAIGRQDDSLEEQTTSPSTILTKKRGRGRPPKNEALVNTVVEPETAANDEEDQPQAPESKSTEDTAENLAADEATETEPTQEAIAATPAKKRGRPKSTAVDESPLVIATPVTASVKKRGRPSKATTAESLDKKQGGLSQSEAQKIEEPRTKRRRRDYDMTMEDAPKEPQEKEAQEDQSASVQERKVAFAANAKASKQPPPIKVTRRGSTSTSAKTNLASDNPRPSSQLGGRTRSSRETTGAEVPEESAVMEQIEPPVAELPKPTMDIVFDERKLGKKPAVKRTYSKRLRR